MPGIWYARVVSYGEEDVDTPLFSNVVRFRVRYWQDFRFRLATVHTGAVPAGYTYNGDTVRAAFRDLNGRGRSTRYRVCYRRNWQDVCVRRRTRGTDWNAWRVDIAPPWAGFNNGRYTRRVVFRWYAGGRLIEKDSLIVLE